jgi:triacylglycerol lipase
VVVLLAVTLGGCASNLGGGGDPDPDAAAGSDAALSGDASPAGDGSLAGDASTTGCGDATTLPPLDLGELRVGGESREVTVTACHAGQLRVVAAAGQGVRIAADGATKPGTVAVSDALGVELGSAAFPGPVDVTAPAAGALRVTVTALDPASPVTIRLMATCTAACELEATRYPILLVHGAGGANFFGDGEYFWDVAASLAERGYLVYTPELTPWGHSEARAAELAVYLDGVRAETGAGKVHLIGHSQAGFDFRALLGSLHAGARVATATSIATPHAGMDESFASASSYYGMDITEDYITGEFSANNPEDASVPRFSWAGATCGALETACLATYDQEIVAAALANTYLTLRGLYADDGLGGDNDGVVPVSTATWGELLGVLPADHWDLVGQIPLQRLGSFDTQAFFLSEARRLRALEIEAGI